MDTIKAIKTRRSIRSYTPQKIEESLIRLVLESGSYAPSGLNNQPWSFVVVEDREIIQQISSKTKYAHIVNGAPLIICIYLDKSLSYNYVKDVQAIGACIQNILLASHENGLGCCWLGEILNRADEVNKILEVPEEYELMAVVTLGYPAETGEADRKQIDEMIYSWI